MFIKALKRIKEEISSIKWPSLKEVFRVSCLVVGIILALALPLYLIDIFSVYFFSMVRSLVWSILDWAGF